MTFKITIKEVHEAVVEIDAENYFEALAKVETDYWGESKRLFTRTERHHI